jgi:hypothetical protein
MIEFFFHLEHVVKEGTTKENTNKKGNYDVLSYTRAEFNYI